MMNWFEKVERYYKGGFYDNAKVKIFVVTEKITDVQYKQITNEDYMA